MSGILEDLNLVDFTGCIKDIKKRAPGGIRHLFVTEFEDLDLASFTFDANGKILTWGLLPGASLLWLQPTQDENTTGSIVGARATARSPILRTPTFIVEVDSLGEDQFKLESILDDGCDLVIFEVINGCTVRLHGIGVEICGGQTNIQAQLQGIRLTATSDEFGTITTERINTWTFSGITDCKYSPVDTTYNDLLAQRTNCL